MYILVRLPLSVSKIFSQWLEEHFPDRKQKVLALLSEMRGGKLNDPRFGFRMRGEGEYSANLSKMFHIYAKKFGLNEIEAKLSTQQFRRVSDQLAFL